MSLTCCIERLVDVLEELKPHFDPHWQELALDQAHVPLDPQYGVYLQRDAQNEVLCVILREKGAIRGYFVGFVCPGLHYQSTLTLTHDISWLHPNLRGIDSLGELEEEMALEMIYEVALKEARRRGVQRVYFGTKLHKNIGRLYERLGLVEVERYFSAWIGRA